MGSFKIRTQDYFPQVPHFNLMKIAYDKYDTKHYCLENIQKVRYQILLTRDGEIKKENEVITSKGTNFIHPSCQVYVATHLGLHV